MTEADETGKTVKSTVFNISKIFHLILGQLKSDHQNYKNTPFWIFSKLSVSEILWFGLHKCQ